MKETKTLTAQIKQTGEAGEFEAVIATLNVVDKDGDIVMPGCLDGKTLNILPAHDSRHVALGKSTIEERQNGDALEAVAVGKFNMDIQAAREWHSALKFDMDKENGPSLQEFSWDLIPTDARPETRDGETVRLLYAVDSKEMSMVLRGASVNTRTLAVKSHSDKTETSSAPWNPIANARRAKGQPDQYAHHFIGEDGEVGAASTRACLLGIADLNSVGVSDPVYRKGLYEHLAGHLKDADIEPPDLLPESKPGLKLTDQIRFARWQTEAALERLQNVSAERAKAGRGVGAEVKAELAKLAAESEKLCAALGAAMTTDGPDDAVSQALTAWAVGQARRAHA